MVVDYDAPSVAILAMPPDLWVQVSQLDQMDAATLTQAFYYGKLPPPQGEPAAVRKATQVVAQAMLDNFDYRTQKYLTLNEPVFADMVDKLGGVEVDVLEYVDATPEGYGIYEPGPQMMDGMRALNFVRLLQPAGQPPSEWARFSRQNQVIVGIQNEMVQPENWIKIPALIKDFYHLLVTDLKPKEINSLMCMLQEVGSDATILEVTPDMVTPGPDGVLLPDVTAIQEPDCPDAAQSIIAVRQRMRPAAPSLVRNLQFRKSRQLC